MIFIVRVSCYFIFLMIIDKFISTVEKQIADFLQSSVFVHNDIGGMQKAAEHLCLSNVAKRMRAVLVYTFGVPFKPSYDRLTKIASTSELIHVASLLHDDVIDTSSQRRGKPTANIIHGNTIAVLTGDLLYSQALEFLEDTSMEILQSAIQVVKKMTIASSLEYNERGNIKADINIWTKITQGKTVCLFSWCTQAPSLLVDCDPKLTALFARVGEKLGLAFQLADDIKDFFASTIIGKPLYSDIQNQNTNYVLIKAMEESHQIKLAIEEMWREKNESGKNIQPQKIKTIGDQILTLESFQESLEQLKIWIQTSLQELETNDFKEISQLIKTKLGKIFHSLPSEILKSISLS